MDTPSNNTVYNRNGTPETGFLNAKDAYELDQQLFNGGYTLEQLMELAGLSVAQAVYDCVPFHMDDHQAGPSSSFAPSILVSFLATTLKTHCFFAFVIKPFVPASQRLFVVLGTMVGMVLSLHDILL